MSALQQANLSSRSTYYVMNLKNDHWVKISDIYYSLEEAKKAYLNLLKRYPFARLGGSTFLAVE